MRQYQDSLQYIYSLIKFGIKLGLENPRRLLELAGTPQKSFRSIHIAGTNGKGSTSRALHQILLSAGARTGLFTSPHMVRFTERIMVDQQEIRPEEVVSITEFLKGCIRQEPDLKPTYFEFVTAMAFCYFKQRAVDWAVIETGMGGRFDATNVIIPEVCVITTIGLDHRQYLGDTLEAIAYEKAGIIKEGIPLVIGPVEDSPRGVLLQVARTRNSEVRLYGQHFRCKVKKLSPEGTLFDFYSSILDSPIRNLFVPVVGLHQAINATLAVEAFLLCHGTGPYSVEAIRAGLGGLHLPGRFEVVEFSGKKLVLDGAHNRQAIEALLESIKVFGQDTVPVVVFGAMADKDITEILEPLVRTSEEIIFTRPSYERAEAPEVLLRIATEIAPEKAHLFKTVSSVGEALRRATTVSDKDIVLVTGSFYVVGEAKEALGQSPVLKDLREGV